jgi:pimeloyl-ACP methyl ester carboxylesterase
MRLLHRATPPIVDVHGHVVAESISRLETPVINGIPQGILVRGHSRRNPALLILHGGPGGAYIGAAREWFGSLESRWVVVNWDERGAGISFSRTVSPHDLTASQISKDALAVVDWVRSNVGVERFYLLGHSFGTLVGPHVLEAAPRAFEGYFSVSTAPTSLSGESAAYAWTLQRARLLNQRKAIRDLGRIGPPPYRSPFGGLDVRARWTDRLGGAWEGTTGLSASWKALRHGTEYTWGDLFLRVVPGVKFWMRNVDESLGSVDLSERFPSLPIPTTFVNGTADYMAPTETARRYFEHLEAPQKRFIELPGVGHYPFAQAPDAFAAAVSPDPW